MIVIDGARGEGGGQILRSSLALSLVTGQPFTMQQIRAGRGKPGLLRQHLTALKAAAEIGQAEIEGAELGSLRIVFRPASVKAGQYRFAIGSAGSATLVMQTVLPTLMQAKEPSTLTIEGGTHNSAAPPFDFIARAFLPVLNRMGARVEVSLERPGFYPAGGGILVVRINPAELHPIELLERGEIRVRSVVGRLAGLPRNIADREVHVFRQLAGWDSSELSVEELPRHFGPGNVLVAAIESEHVTEVFTGFGERNVRGETVTQDVADEVREYVAANVPIGPHLADQLLIPLAMAGGGSFRTVAPTTHTETQVETIRAFMDARIDLREESNGAWRIDVGRA